MLRCEVAPFKSRIHKLGGSSVTRARERMQPLERTSQGIFSALTAGVSFKTRDTGAAVPSSSSGSCAALVDFASTAATVLYGMQLEHQPTRRVTLQVERGSMKN